MIKLTKIAYSILVHCVNDYLHCITIVLHVLGSHFLRYINLQHLLEKYRLNVKSNRYNNTCT